MQSTFRALKQLTGVLPVQLASSLSCATGIRKIRLYATPLDRSGRPSPQRKARRSRESGDEEDESERVEETVMDAEEEEERLYSDRLEDLAVVKCRGCGVNFLYHQVIALYCRQLSVCSVVESLRFEFGSGARL